MAINDQIDHYNEILYICPEVYATAMRDKSSQASCTQYTRLLYDALNIEKESIDIQKNRESHPTFYHDLNNSVENSLFFAEVCGKYDYVLDYGTSEHIFGYSNVIKNVLKMLKPGGLYIYRLPHSGWYDHCLYHFNPRVFHDIGNTQFFNHVHQFLATTSQDLKNNYLYSVRSSYCLHSDLIPVILEVWGVLQKTGSYTLDQINALDVQQNEPSQDYENTMIQVSISDLDNYLNGIPSGTKFCMPEYGKYVVNNIPQPPLFPPMIDTLKAGLKSSTKSNNQLSLNS